MPPGAIHTLETASPDRVHSGSLPMHTPDGADPVSAESQVQTAQALVEQSPTPGSNIALVENAEETEQPAQDVEAEGGLTAYGAALERTRRFEALASGDLSYRLNEITEAFAESHDPKVQALAERMQSAQIEDFSTNRNPKASNGIRVLTPETGNIYSTESGYRQSLPIARDVIEALQRAGGELTLQEGRTVMNDGETEISSVFDNSPHRALLISLENFPGLKVIVVVDRANEGEYPPLDVSMNDILTTPEAK